MEVGAQRGLAGLLELLKEGVQEALQSRTLVCHGSRPPAGPSPAALARERAAERQARERHLEEQLEAYRQVRSLRPNQPPQDRL